MTARTPRLLALLLVAFVAALSVAGAAIATVEDATPPVTTDDSDGLWHNTDVSVSLTATDDLSGVGATNFSWDAAVWIPGSVVTKLATADHLNDGEHTLSYYSVDGIGNMEIPKSCLVRIDTQLPVTTVSGNDALWHNAPVVLAFAGADQDGLAGIALTEYRIDSRAWTTGLGATVKAPANHSWDGKHTVQYRSRDLAGNLELARSAAIKIDTRGPVCSAPAAASGVQGSYATLRYRVNDALSAQADVTLRVKTPSGSTVKTVDLGRKSTNKGLSYRFKCALTAKSYRYVISARDLAGNSQSRVGVNTLTVQPRRLASLSASVSDSTPAQYTDVTVTTRAKDQAGHGLSGVKCVFRWRYKTTTPSETRYTDSSGIARCTRGIAGATAGYRVYVTVTATYRGVAKTATTSFVPH